MLSPVPFAFLTPWADKASHCVTTPERSSKQPLDAAFSFYLDQCQPQERALWLRGFSAGRLDQEPRRHATGHDLHLPDRITTR